MKRFLISILLFLIFNVPNQIFAISPNLFLSLTTDKLVFNSTDPVAMALTVLNTSNKTSNVSFSSSLIFDFTLSYDNQPVWKWSDDKMFAQSITSVEFLPGKPRTYLFVYNPNQSDTPKLAPGKYKLVGSLHTTNKTYLSDPVWIEIRN